MLGVAALLDRTPRSLAATAMASLVGLAIASQYSEHAASARVQGIASQNYDELLYVTEGPDSTVAVARGAGTVNLVIDGFRHRARRSPPITWPGWGTYRPWLRRR